MYTKQLVYKEFIKSLGMWVEKTLKVTDDSLWFHHNKLSIRNSVKEILVQDLHK